MSTPWLLFISFMTGFLMSLLLLGVVYCSITNEIHVVFEGDELDNDSDNKSS